MMDKELALAIDFKKAPKEVQDAATAHYTNVKALAKAKKKIFDTQTEVDIAQNAYLESEKVLKKALKSWEPEV